MYQLTCPSCSSQASSPFVRHGAVVRCESCEKRYRVKSSFVTRTVTTGPMTLDEMDPLLRGDSVDLDSVETPDNAAPVKIDDDGNVVGLSGLSELMRQSDAAHAQATAIARTRASDNTPPPAARVTRAAEPASSAAPDPIAVASAPRPARARARARRGKNKRSNGLLIVVALLALAFAVGVLALVISITTGDEPITENPPADPSANPPTNPDGPAGNPSANPDLFPDARGTEPEPTPDGPEGPDDPNWLTHGSGKEDNPDYRYRPASRSGASAAPVDVPTVLAASQPMTHEGWYILTPPRGSVEATGTSKIELGPLEPADGTGDVVMLQGQLTNAGENTVVSGEAHVALVDASGRVFAETYMPFAALGPGQVQPVQLAIPLRHWGRARDVRTRVNVLDESRQLDELPDVRVKPAGSGGWASARVSVHNAGRRWLRDVVVLVWAQDAAGNRVASFRSVQDDLYIEPDGWLDIVVRTPIAEDAGPLQWHARVIRR